jgi:hypothetical protein
MVNPQVSSEHFVKLEDDKHIQGIVWIDKNKPFEFIQMVYVEGVISDRICGGTGNTHIYPLCKFVTDDELNGKTFIISHKKEEQHSDLNQFLASDFEGYAGFITDLSTNAKLMLRCLFSNYDETIMTQEKYEKYIGNYVKEFAGLDDFCEYCYINYSQPFVTKVGELLCESDSAIKGYEGPDSSAAVVEYLVSKNMEYFGLFKPKGFPNYYLYKKASPLCKYNFWDEVENVYGIDVGNNKVKEEE